MSSSEMRWPMSLVIAAALSAGCGSSDSSGNVVPVEGRVKFNGTPVSKGMVVLYPDADKDNTTPYEPRGSIDANGRFKITQPYAGAPPGWYKVAVIATEAIVDPNNPYLPPRWLIPEKFGNIAESGLVLEVRVDARQGAYDFDLQ
jgi:hypothetical protein